jgi:hypothetical protein
MLVLASVSFFEMPHKFKYSRQNQEGLLHGNYYIDEQELCCIGIISVSFLGIFVWNQSGDHPQENLTKFGNIYTYF